MEKAVVSYKEQRGEVFFDPHKVDASQIVAKVHELGFKATLIGRATPEVGTPHDIDALPERK